MKGERLQRTLTIAVVVLFALALLAQFFLPTPELLEDRPSTASFEPSGRRACFEVFRALGMEPEEWRKSPGALPRGEHVLWTADAPFETQSTEPERSTKDGEEDGEEEKAAPQSGRFDLRARAHYRAFVEQGGTIVLPWTQRTRKFLLEDFEIAALEAAPDPAPLEGARVTRIVRIPDGSELASTWLPDRALPPELLDAGADPYWVAAREDGTEDLLAATFRLGEGTLVVLVDDDFADNAHLGSERNAELCVRLLEERWHGGRLLFDEYALGRWDPETAASLVLGTDLLPATLHLLLLLVLFVWGAAWVRAFPRDPEPLEQLSPLSRARALAHLLRRAGRIGLLAQFLRRGELARLARAARLARFGVEPPNAEAVERELLLAAQRTQSEDELARWRKAFLVRKAGDEHELDALARDLDAIVERAKHGARAARGGVSASRGA